MFQLVPRSRGDNNSVYQSLTAYRQSCTPTNGPYWWSNRPNKVSRWKLDGEDVVDYHKHLAEKRLIPITRFTKTTCEGTHDGRFYQVYNPTGCTQFMTNDEGTEMCLFKEEQWALTEPEHFEQWLPSGVEYYAQKAAAKCYSAGHDSLTFLAELSKTKKMFIHTVQDLLRGKFLKGKYWDKAVASRWLEGRYGWRTLKYDIEDLNEAISNLSKEADRIWGRTYDSYRTISNTDVAWKNGEAYGTLYFHDEIKVELKGFVIAEFDPAEFSFNPLVTGWELLTWSFIIDWLVNVGQMIAALSFITFNPTFYACYGYKITVNREFHTITEGSTPDWSTNSGLWGECESTLVRRVPCDIPKLPFINLRIDALKIMDLLALLLGLTRR